MTLKRVQLFVLAWPNSSNQNHGSSKPKSVKGTEELGFMEAFQTKHEKFDYLVRGGGGDLFPLGEIHASLSDKRYHFRNIMWL